MITIQENGMVDARELHNLLGMKTRFDTWITRLIDSYGFIEGKDFRSFLSKSTGGRQATEYQLTIDTAKESCMYGKSKRSSEFRKYFVSLSNRVEQGLLWTPLQINALMDLAKSLTLVSVQKEVERRHFDLFNQPKEWYNYRAELLGYSKETLTNALTLVNKKYVNTRVSLLQLDACTLIKTGAIDLAVALGKTPEYAKNMGELCYDMAKRMDLQKEFWDDEKPNPLKLNESIVSKKKELFCETQKKI
jgi:phage anti-repressor protein